MRALVVYESMFGNTKTVAEAIGEGVARHLAVTVIDVSAAPTTLPADVGLLVAGGPTHAFGMSRRSTRQAAGQQAGSTVTPVSTGLREWLTQLAGPSASIVAAAFDTRVKRRGLPGSAARKVERRLRRLGFHSAADATSFWVSDTPGPLLDGERTRAQEWGSELAAGLLREGSSGTSIDALDGAGLTVERR
jgi:hypothetical protein